ncbi:hypothetical protein BT93_L2525 [Corymbia citriodora subsp. variegata]|uniref:Sialate O-acetylesterase domain-containing protein n=1 Tax=Corymbia citriodora subsp. variegata TaxID=360336 RepID=A0A8T0CJG5_CORYI|nr:hypothetical protein BT93_L2525 [Corymbia citriodora subsp. variegata]
MGAATSAPAQPPAPPPPPPAKHIFILSGQSNMAGRGGVTRHHGWDRVVPPECRPDPSILRLSADLRWEEACAPLHRDIDTRKTCGVGPGMAFANALRERRGGGDAGAVVGLVPCAVGGTAIREWERGGHLYESMVKRARESVKDGGGGGGGGEIKALLWYQGESDASTQHDAEAYGGKMEALIKNVRDDLGLPSLPVIQVRFSLSVVPSGELPIAIVELCISSFSSSSYLFFLVCFALIKRIILQNTQKPKSE